MSNGQQQLQADVQLCQDTGYMLGMVSKVIFGGSSFRRKHLVLETTYLHIKAGEGAFHPEASLTRIGIDCVNYEDTDKGPGVSFRYQHRTYHIAFSSEEQRNQWFDCLGQHARQKSPQPERKRDSSYHTAASQMHQQQRQPRVPPHSPEEPEQQQQQEPETGPLDRLPSYNTSELRQQQQQQPRSPDQTQSSQSGLRPPSYQEASQQPSGAKSF